MHILICDDNIATHETISAYLLAEGATYVSAYDGEQLVEEYTDPLLALQLYCGQHIQF